MPQAHDAGTGSGSLFDRLKCRLNRHKPIGHRADWDGDTYVSKCEYCEAPIKRLRKGTWRRTD